jgi:hypothetical protein
MVKVHPSITLLARVRDEVRNIRLTAKRDAEAAHGREDRLYEDVLRFLASGQATKDDAVALATAALKTKDVDFVRWTA